MKRIKIALMMLTLAIIPMAVISFLSFAQPPIQTKPIKPAPASILNARIIECREADILRGTSSAMVIVWTYGSGLKPERVTIFVRGESGVRPGAAAEVDGSVTQIGLALSKKANIKTPLGYVTSVPYQGSLDMPFTLTFTANYVLSGSRTYTFTKRCGE